MTDQRIETQTLKPAAALKALIAPEGKARKRGEWLSVFAALVWPMQAACIASVIAALLGGAGLSPVIGAIAFVALAGLRALLDSLAQKMLLEAAERALLRLRQALIVQEASAAAHSAHAGPGALAALIGEKLEALRPFMMRYRPAALRVMVQSGIILGITFWHSWAVGIVLLLAGPLIPVFMMLVGWAAKEASARQMVEIGQIGDLLLDRLAALSDLTLLNAGPQVVDSFGEATEDLRSRTMAVLRIAFLSSTVLELFAALGVAMVAVWVGFSLLGELSWGSWGDGLTPFSGVFLLLLAPDYFQPLRDLAAAWHDKAAAEAVADEWQMLDAETRPRILGQGAKVAPLSGAVNIATRDLRLGPNGQILLPDFDILPGAKIGISGPSGAGKTTLLRALAGLMPVYAGAILINGAPLGEGNADALRARMGWMPQQPLFLSRSLRHNIAFGAPLEDAHLQAAALQPVILAQAKGLGTQLGETGAGLSGGEGRRVMLARALHADADILLADEPTADLDAQTAAQVIQGLVEFAAQGRTLIVASHDPAVLRQMDHVIDLKARPLSDPEGASA